MPSAIAGYGTHRHGYDQVLAAAAMLVAFAARFARFSFQLFLITESCQCVLVAAGQEQHVAAIAAIAAVRAAAGNEFLAAETQFAVAAGASQDLDRYRVNETH